MSEPSDLEMQERVMAIPTLRAKRRDPAPPAVTSIAKAGAFAGVQRLWI